MEVANYQKAYKISFSIRIDINIIVCTFAIIVHSSNVRGTKFLVLQKSTPKVGNNWIAGAKYIN